MDAVPGANQKQVDDQGWKISTYLDILNRTLTRQGLPRAQKLALLTALKVHSRTLQAGVPDPMCTKDGFTTLVKLGLESEDIDLSREALRCASNVMFLHEQTRQMFVDTGLLELAIKRLQQDDRDDEFLLARILFFCTYGTNLDFEELVEKQELANIINQNIKRHRERLARIGGETIAPIPISTLALSETLKLLYNVCYRHPSLVERFSASIPPILELLAFLPLPSPPLEPPISNLVNALTTLNLSSTRPRMFPKLLPTRLTTLLSQSLSSYSPASYEATLSPLVLLLRRIYPHLPAPAQQTIRDDLLPSSDDRAKPLGTTDSLPSILLRQSTAAATPLLSDNISGLLFELSGSDPLMFVRNVGYGYASGFLMRHNIPVSEGDLRAGGSGAMGVTDRTEAINPITGQKLSAEEQERRTGEKMPEMTMEEKEREAERLFVLFERLKATGVVDVKNPVEEAMREGRLEEIE